MDVVYSGTSSAYKVIGDIYKFTSFLGHPFLLWSPCFYALLGIGC
ncbi:hypothetical protein Hanom_Chr14g01316861 [Helianthus anomalus]